MTRKQTVDERFAALADASRRRVLRHLCADGGTGEIEFDALLSGLTDNAPPASEARTRTKSNLVHVHLPKLERAQLVEYDDESVELCASAEVIEDALDLAERLDTDGP